MGRRGCRIASRAAALAGLALAGLGAGPLPAAAEATAGAAGPPADCRPVAPGSALQEIVDAAAGGEAFCLAPGDYRGPVRITRPILLYGPREARIRSEGAGSTLSVEAAGAALVGFSVDGSGGRFDLLDVAVRIAADDVRVEGLEIRHALFGVLASQVNRARILGNEIVGNPKQTLGLRGDAIRLWEVRGSRVEGNHVRDARDVVVWYSPGNELRNNVIERGRYGTHFMYSHHNVIEGNRLVGNVVGIFLMYSRHVRVENNLLARSGGAAGMGLGAKESGDLRVTGNWIVGNAVGIHLDTSPLQLDEWNVFEGNAIRLSPVGISFQGTTDRNRFIGNSFRDLDIPVRMEGRGDARAAEWRGNDWGDYAGYDLDGDGVGDLPYELRTLAGELTARHPQLALFRGTPALQLVELVGHVVPLFRPTTILVDPAPRMGPPPLGEPPGAG
jgi:nitrous oxidase accessory protein